MSLLAASAARTVLDGFRSYGDAFLEVTRRARGRFEDRDWAGAMEDMSERLGVHSAEVNRTIGRLRRELGAAVDAPDLWTAARVAYAKAIAGHRNRDLEETFFNSVVRRVLGVVGKNPDAEFDAPAATVDPRSEDPPVFRRYEDRRPTHERVAAILGDCRFRSPFQDLDRDAHVAAARIDGYLTEILRTNRIDAIEVIDPVFFRQKLAYVIGRIRTTNHVLPLVLALRHDEDGIRVDAALMSQDELSVIFSFARSHFQVDTACPRDLVVFLKGIMPLKPLAELYIALGFHKHGKTEMYRALRDHLETSVDRFEHAPGEEGMVMLVFTLPFYGLVFKIIRDRFGFPKNNTRQDVIDRYRLVFTHDRVGRMVEAQEFEYLEFDVGKFREELLEDLTREAANTVEIDGDKVVIRHVYLERKVTPLDLYVRESTTAEALEAVDDYGAAVKELAAANIFPGDFLMKNFGVTRHGRVVFYDYDELCFLTRCNFRRIPPPRTPEDEMSDEPWFTVGPDDIFPEEFENFLSLRGPLKARFMTVHGDLLDADYWSDLQDRIRAGEIVDTYPYPRSKCLGG